MKNNFFNRILPGVLYGIIALEQINGAAHFVLVSTNQDLSFWLTLLHILLGFFFTSLTAFLLFNRRSIISHQATFFQKLIALAGTLIVWLLVFLPVMTTNWLILIIGDLLAILGSLIAICALVTLRWNFGIAPEARGLVTTGAYKFIRHPMYLGEFILFIGLVIPLFSILSLLILALFCYFQLQRMQFEEQVLSQEFPQYKKYRQQTPALLPWSKSKK